MMQWDSWQAFWHMGGAAWYVWGSYGVALVLVAAELFLVLRRPKQTIARLRRLRRAGARARAPLSTPAAAAVSGAPRDETA